MNRYKISIEYDGTLFHGWQRQNGFDSIQQRVEESMTPFLKEKTAILGSGRTDTGVHAFSQVAHFDYHSHIDCFRLKECMNFYLSEVAISILSIEEVSRDFNARLSAKERSYIYKISNRKSKLAIDINRVWQVGAYLDEKKMHQVAQHLVGKHDFSSFRAAGCQAKSPIKTINTISVRRDDDIITVFIAAKSFLYHQVRNIVGSLEKVGNGKWTEADFLNVFNSKDRTKAGATAPACGLYFVGTKY